MKVAKNTRRNTALVALIAVFIGAFLTIGSAVAFAVERGPDGNRGCGNGDGTELSTGGDLVDEANGCKNREEGSNGGGNQDPVCADNETLTDGVCVANSSGNQDPVCADNETLTDGVCVANSSGDNTGGTIPPVPGGVNAGEDDVLGNVDGGGNTTPPASGTDGGSDDDGTDVDPDENTTGGTDNGGSRPGPEVLPTDPIDNDDKSDDSDDPATQPAREDASNGGAPQADSLPGQVLPSADAQPAAGVLPFTGSDHLPVLLIGLWLIAIGSVVLLTSGTLARK